MGLAHSLRNCKKKKNQRKFLFHKEGWSGKCLENWVLFTALNFIFRSERSLETVIETGVIKFFCRTQGHGLIIPDKEGEEIFVHISE